MLRIFSRHCRYMVYTDIPIVAYVTIGANCFCHIGGAVVMECFMETVFISASISEMDKVNLLSETADTANHIFTHGLVAALAHGYTHVGTGDKQK